MERRLSFPLLLALLSSALPVRAEEINAKIVDESLARQYLESYEVKASEACNKAVLASWDYNTNVTEFNEKKSVRADLEFASFQKEAWKNVTKFDWEKFQDEATRRQFRLLSVLGTSALPDAKLAEFKNSISKMETIYSTTKICSYTEPKKCDLALEPEITEILAKSRDYNETLHLWTQWHNLVGAAAKQYYEPYVKLGNEAAKLNGKKDMGELWRAPFETDTLEADLAELWEELKPFYLQLHAFVRGKLSKIYGEDLVNRRKAIPAHILGNMWAQDWTNLLKATIPYENASAIDVTDELLAQNYTVEKIFRTSEDFFLSLDLEKMPDSFWEKSMLEKPKDGREVVCHASAWDFCDRKDVRIKMCTVVNQEDLITVHHEMGHIQYYLQYASLPITFREGANEGFHEAVGDVLALSVSTPTHLKAVGLLKDVDSSLESDINFLYRMALEKIAFLPFGYVIDLYRWRLFRGDINESDWNSEWWVMRKALQGIEPVVARTSDTFDPAAKYHVAADVPYIRYFVSFVIQFQFHEGLCLAAKQFDPNDPSKPLHKCDIYKNKDAGAKLGKALKMGYSRPWPEVMEILTGQLKMRAAAIKNYFKPLIDFLEKENKANGEYIGWDD